MKHFNCPNLVIVEQDDITVAGEADQELTIIAKHSHGNIPNVEKDDLQDVIYRQSGFQIPIQSISRYLADFIIQAPNEHIHRSILSKGIASSGDWTFVLIPWSPAYNSTEVPYNSVRSTFSTLYTPPYTLSTAARTTPIQIEITGTPPHLCSDRNIVALLEPVCDIKNISFQPANFTYLVDATTADSNQMPLTATLGIQKFTSQGHMLCYWPIWYDITPLQIDDHIDDDMDIQSPPRRGASYEDSDVIRSFNERLFDDRPRPHPAASDTT